MSTVTAIRAGQARPKRRKWGGRIAFLLAALVLFALGWGDRLVGNYQERLLQEKREAKQRLERLTLFALRADTDTVEYLGDGGYAVTVFLENVYPERDLYVMIPSIRVFVQVGALWHEVPSQALPGQWTEGQVVRLTERIRVRRRFEVPPGREYAELLAGYWHVQFVNTLLTSDSSAPQDDIGERTDTYYVHLLPIGADRAAVARQHSFPGGTPPLFLPMPPH